MAAGPWVFVNSFRDTLLDSYIDGASARTFKVGLYLSTSNISTSSTTIAGVTNEHAAANGYTAGGISVTLSRSGTTSVPVSFAVNPTWTASGGSIVARFGVLYAVGLDVAAFCLLDSTPADVTTTTGNTFTLDADSSPSSIFTLA